LKRKIIEKLYPLNRTLANNDTDKAFEIIKTFLDIKIHKIKSGAEAFTWIVPDRWEVEHASVKDTEGNKILDFNDNPLYLASYSDSFTGWVTKSELLSHMSTSKKMPNHIPFSYRYYVRDWHVSLEYNKFVKLNSEKYYVDIKTKFSEECMALGEYTLFGLSDEIILFICNICHPYQVNDSITGVATFISLMKKIEAKNKKPRFTYKLLICPETIGSLAYLAKFKSLIGKIKYGIFCEMTGIDQPVRLINSVVPDSKIDRVAESVLKGSSLDYEIFPAFSAPCNDEKIFNSPGFDIPTISIVRWPYDEYHTSADNPTMLDYEKIDEVESIINEIIENFEKDYIPRRKYTGYLCLSRYGLDEEMRNEKGVLSDVCVSTLSSLDNKTSIFEIAYKNNMSFRDVFKFCEKLKEKELIEPIYYQ